MPKPAWMQHRGRPHLPSKENTDCFLSELQQQLKAAEGLLVAEADQDALRAVGKARHQLRYTLEQVQEDLQGCQYDRRTWLLTLEGLLVQQRELTLHEASIVTLLAATEADCPLDNMSAQMPTLCAATPDGSWGNAVSVQETESVSSQGLSSAESEGEAASMGCAPACVSTACYAPYVPPTDRTSALAGLDALSRRQAHALNALPDVTAQIHALRLNICDVRAGIRWVNQEIKALNLKAADLLRQLKQNRKAMGEIYYPTAVAKERAASKILYLTSRIQKVQATYDAEHALWVQWVDEAQAAYRKRAGLPEDQELEVYVPTVGPAEGQQFLEEPRACRPNKASGPYRSRRFPAGRPCRFCRKRDRVRRNRLADPYQTFEFDDQDCAADGSWTKSMSGREIARSLQNGQTLWREKRHCKGCMWLKK